jgi:hypothetical protein
LLLVLILDPAVTPAAGAAPCAGRVLLLSAYLQAASKAVGIAVWERVAWAAAAALWAVLQAAAASCALIRRFELKLLCLAEAQVKAERVPHLIQVCWSCPGQAQHTGW